LIDLPVLTHAQQQQAVEKIQQLMAEGLSSGEAIAQVANAIRSQQHQEVIPVILDDDDEHN
jgi:uncharacterized protein